MHPSQREIPLYFAPAFAAAPGESFREFQRLNELWIASEAGQLPDTVIGVLMVRMLSAQAALLCRYLPQEQLSSANIWVCHSENPSVIDLRHTASARCECANPWVMHFKFGEFVGHGFAHPFVLGSRIQEAVVRGQ